MPNLDPSDLLLFASIVGGIIGLAVLMKVAYAVRSYLPMPPKKPMICLLPKYTIELSLKGNDQIDQQLSSLLEPLGFEIVLNDGQKIVFTRGSELGDFSINIARVIATASLPFSNPVQLNVEYGVALGVMFDTGDLWTFCNELRQRAAVN